MATLTASSMRVRSRQTADNVFHRHVAKLSQLLFNDDPLAMGDTVDGETDAELKARWKEKYDDLKQKMPKQRLHRHYLPQL